MQHDIVELLDFVKYAQDNFPSDRNQRLWFTRENLTDAFGKEYRLDRCSFFGCSLFIVATGTRIEITVNGLGDDVAYQRKFIADTIAAHRNGTF